MYASLILGYHSSAFEIKDYYIDKNTDMVTLTGVDGIIQIVHKSRVIVYMEEGEKQ